MPKSIGRHAIVVGAGMGGLAAAKALSSCFEAVTILERDALPSAPIARSGTPQARQIHVLLRGGLDALMSSSPVLKQSSSAPGPFACGSALNLSSNCRASIRFRGAILGSTISA